MFALFKSKEKKSEDREVTSKDEYMSNDHALTKDGQKAKIRSRLGSFKKKNDLTSSCGQVKDDGKTNPATPTNMWRPITMTTSVSRDEDVFTSFNAMPGGRRAGHDVISRTASFPVTATERAARLLADSLPPDYIPHPAPLPAGRRHTLSGLEGRPGAKGLVSPSPTAASKPRLEARRSAPLEGSVLRSSNTTFSDAVQMTRTRAVSRSHSLCVATSRSQLLTPEADVATASSDGLVSRGEVRLMKKRAVGRSSSMCVMPTSGQLLTSGREGDAVSHEVVATRRRSSGRSGLALAMYCTQQRVQEHPGEEAEGAVGVMEAPPRSHPPLCRSLSASARCDVNWKRRHDLPPDYPVNDSLDNLASSLSEDLKESRVDVPVDYPVTSSMDNLSDNDQTNHADHSLMDSSFDVVRTDVGKHVLNALGKAYCARDLAEAASDVMVMLTDLRITLDTLQTSGKSAVRAAGAKTTTYSDRQLGALVEELQRQTRQFLQDAKHFVRATARSRDQLSQSLQASMHTLARLLLHSQAAILPMSSSLDAQHFLEEVVEVTEAFHSTLAAADSGSNGVNDTDPCCATDIKKHALNMATFLSSLLNRLSTLHKA